jgi:hypothetical protein
MDIIKFVDGMLPWLKKEVNSLLSPLENRLSTLEGREVVHGKDGTNGKDGASVSIDDLRSVINQEIVTQFLQVPLAKDGKDGIDGKDGKDADPEYIKSVIAEEVSKVPAAKDGKDADIEQVKALIAEEVAKMPAPKDGKDADTAEIKQFIVDHVATIPLPKDGKDAEPEVIKLMVDEAVAKIDKPKDGVNGKDADLEIVKGFIQQEVKNIPPPKVESFTLEQVEKMVADAVAAAIANIPPAKDGEDGKDALAIQILPAIDESKSYPRGTFALHKNGTWRAYQKTVGMKGWECTQVGIAEIDVEMLDDRTLSIKTMLSNGETQEKTLKLKNIKYKGVVSEGATYEEGDFVTWGGSIWHCDEPTSERPREGHKSWTLAVKKGRDYREPVKNDFDPNKPVKM